MFKKLELWWNARTPVWLHNGTKENIIFQLTAAALILIGFSIADKWDEYKSKKRFNATRDNPPD